MARKQTRRTVSLSISVYETAKEEAAARGLTLAHLTELALIAFGVQAQPGTHQSIDVAERAVRMKVRSARVVTQRVDRLARSGAIRRAVESMQGAR